MRHRRVARLLGCGRGRELPRGTTERSAPISATLKNTYIVPSTNATIAICANVSRCERDRDDDARHGADAHDVGDDHHPLALEAVDGDAGEEAEERPRQDAREADDARLDRRVRHREDEQRIRDPVDSEPIVESVCPTCSRTKSRFLRSGSEASSGERGFDLDRILAPPRQQIRRGERGRRAITTISTR